jgi:hypothetical protein
LAKSASVITNYHAEARFGWTSVGANTLGANLHDGRIAGECGDCATVDQFIAPLRSTLEDDPRGPEYRRTVYRDGYN